MNMLLYSQKKQQSYFVFPTLSDYIVISPGSNYSVSHFHSVYRLMIAEHGSGKITSGNKDLLIKERELVVIPPNVKFNISTEDKLGITYFTFNFYLLTNDSYIKLCQNKDWYKESNYCLMDEYAQTDSLDNLFDLELTDIHVDYDSNKWHDISNIVLEFYDLYETLFDRAIIEYIESSPNNINRYCNESAKFLWDICSMASFSNEDFLKNADPLLYHIINFLKNNITGKYSLQALSEELNYSSVYLCSYFSKRTGTTIQEYFTKLKIQKACQFLRITAKSITEISAILNFSSSSHFCRNFSKIKGFPPNYYRKHLEII